MNYLDIFHPYWLVREILANYHDSIQSVYMSYYSYKRNSIQDDRIVLPLSWNEFFDVGNVKSIIHRTPDGCELAFHSLVKMCDGSELHIPMIDMTTSSFAQLEKLDNFIFYKNKISEIKWFKSGRSYHAYGQPMLKKDEWISFMGRLLLSIEKGSPSRVDYRWIGHRLVAGYGALRWTKNTENYKQIPHLVTNIK